MKIHKIIILSLILFLFACGCVASKTTKQGKSSNSEESQDSIEVSTTCPENVSGEEKYCQIFTQKGGKSNRPIDILWVIDNSTSMCDNQTKLAKILPPLSTNSPANPKMSILKWRSFQPHNYPMGHTFIAREILVGGCTTFSTERRLQLLNSKLTNKVLSTSFKQPLIRLDAVAILTMRNRDW